MDSTFKSLRIVRLALLASIVLYAVLGEIFAPGNNAPHKVVFFAFTAIAVLMVLVSFIVRRLLIARVESEMKAAAGDQSMLHRWRGGYFVSFAFSEAIALLGFILRMLNFSLSQVAPFYIVGFFLLIFFSPRRPAQQESRAATS